MWCLGTCFSGGLRSAELMAGFETLKGFSSLNNSMIIQFFYFLCMFTEWQIHPNIFPTI